MTNTGAIVATGAHGVGVCVGAPGGNVGNAAGGLIQGYDIGIAFSGSFGTVANLRHGAQHLDRLLRGNYVDVGGLITNGAPNNTTALITGPTRAIQFNNASPAAQSVGTVVNFGTIASMPTGTAGAGIELDFGGLVVNGPSGATGALITSSRTAVFFKTFSGTLNNFGQITDTGAAAAVYVGAGGTITNGTPGTSNGIIAGAATGVSIRNASANLTNSGTIASTGTSFPSAAIYMNAGGQITNGPGGLIAANQNALLAFTVGANLANDGTVVSTGSQASAVYLGHGGTVANGATLNNALVTGNAGAVFIKNGFGLVNNLGTLVDASTAAGAGVYLSTGGAVVNGSGSNQTALIASGLTGIAARHQFATVNNFGTVASTGQRNVSTGVYLNAGGIIANQAGATIASYMPAVDVISFGGTPSSSVSISNNGSIESSGSSAAAYVSNTFANITNNATILNTGTGNAMGLNTVGTVVNNGTVVAAGGIGVRLGGTGGSKAIVTFDNNLVITGKTGVLVNLLDTGYNTLVNNGTITGTGGTAFAFGGGDDTLVVDPGSVLNGAVANFHPGSRIDFANQVGTSVSFANGVMTLLNGNNVVYSLTLSGSFDPAQFAVGADGNGGTNVTLNAPPQQFAPATLALASFGAAPNGGGWSSQDLYPRVLGDANGDGLADIVGFGAAGAYVSLATGNGNFASPILGVANFGSSPAGGGWTSQDAYPRELADVNGDKMGDIVGFGAAGVFTSLAAGGGSFAAPTLALAAFGQAGGWSSQDIYPREMADVNGDGMADIVAFGATGVYVSLNLGNGTFAQPALALQGFDTAQGWSSQDAFPRELADVTGDGLPDIVGFGSDGVYVAKNLGGGQFAQPTLALGVFGAAGGWNSQDIDPRELADINGDGMADIVGFGSDGVWTALAAGNGTFAQPTFGFNEFGSSANGGGWISQGLYPRELADVTGDKKADVVGFGDAGAYVSPSLIPGPGPLALPS